MSANFLKNTSHLKLNQFLLLSSIDKMLMLLIFMFPILAATAKHGGTTVYILLFLISLFNVKSTINSLSENERYVLYGFLVFVAVTVLGFINTDDIRIATHQLERYLRLIMFIPIFLMFKNKTLQLLEPFLMGCVVATVVMALQAFVQVEVLNNDVAHGAYHKIVFGDTAIILLSVCLAGLIALSKNKESSIFLTIGILSGLYASMMSFTRSSWLAVIVVVIMCLILLKGKITKKQGKKIFLGFVTLLIVGTIWLPKTISNGIDSAVNDIKQYSVNPEIQTSWGGRLKVAHAGWLMFLEEPIIGVGVGDFRYERNRLIKEGKTIDGARYSHAHIHYLNVLAENGIIGLIALILFIYVVPAKAFYRQWIMSDNIPEKRFWSLIGILTLTNFFIFGIAEVWLGRNPLVNIYCFFILVSLVGINANKTLK